MKRKQRLIRIVAFIITAVLPCAYLCAGEISTDLSKLPQPALEFAAKIFPNAKIVGFEIDKALLKPVEYDATLSDGSKIEFDSTGQWTDIESKFTGIPLSIFPADIATYLKNNYKGQKIKSASKEKYGWEVELANGLELKFNAAGKFVGIED